MQIAIKIPDNKIPVSLNFVDFTLQCSDGTILEAGESGFGFAGLPIGHGDLLDKDLVVDAVDAHTFDASSGEGLVLDDDITCILENIPVALKSDRT